MEAMPRLSVVTYNTFQERKGRDPALDALLDEEETLICLQEVKPARALGIKRALGSRAYVSLAKYGLLYLALVLPEDARFLERRAAPLDRRPVLGSRPLAARPIPRRTLRPGAPTQTPARPPNGRGGRAARGCALPGAPRGAA